MLPGLQDLSFPDPLGSEVQSPNHWTAREFPKQVLKINISEQEILGIETTGYLNSHEIRNIETVKISKEQAKLAST